MESNKQAVVVNDFMIAIAPVVTKYTLELNYMAPSEEPEKAVRQRVATIAASLTMEIASHMAARFAQLHDAAQPTETKDSASAGEKASIGKQAKKDPVT